MISSALSGAARMRARGHLARRGTWSCAARQFRGRVCAKRAGVGGLDRIGSEPMIVMSHLVRGDARDAGLRHAQVAEVHVAAKVGRDQLAAIQATALQVRLPAGWSAFVDTGDPRSEHAP
jgi:hypothetical protein